MVYPDLCMSLIVLLHPVLCMVHLDLSHQKSFDHHLQKMLDQLQPCLNLKFQLADSLQLQLRVLVDDERRPQVQVLVDDEECCSQVVLLVYPRSGSL